MNYYTLALCGYFLDELTYESEKEFEENAEVIVDLGRKKDRKAIILKKVAKPNFKTSPIKEATGRFLSPLQRDLAEFIAYYYGGKLSFVLGSFLPSYDYKCEKISLSNAPTLNPIQEKALEFAKKSDRSLLFGDTGSGKTEIYISLIKEHLECGEQVLLLMPEIALTPQMQKRLEVYFKDHFFLWHSKIPKKKKELALEKFTQGKALLVAGARSALFLPFRNLKLIIVDEEHDNSYKANNNPRLNARDLALFLSQKYNTKVLLGSATPSLTSFYKQKSFRLKGTFHKSEKNFIYDESELGISSTLLRELRATLREKKQAIIFLPTRANFRQILCKNCGESLKCPYCSIALSLHKNKNALKCHYCGFVKAIDTLCPSCGGTMLEARKMGTAELCEKLKESLAEFKPEIAKFDSDEITSVTKLNKILKDFNDEKIDILVGTSMLAKGHDYHSVNLSVILGLDEYLFRPNFRASEECLALAMQVAGRAGRAGEARVLIQTKQREFFESYMQDYDRFLQDELELRKDLYPPFKRLLRLIIEDKDKEKARKLCENLATQMKQISNLELVGYGTCGIELIGQKWRFYLLLRSDTHAPLLKAMRLSSIYKEITADIDPIDFS